MLQEQTSPDVCTSKFLYSFFVFFILRHLEHSKGEHVCIMNFFIIIILISNNKPQGKLTGYIFK